MASNSEIVLNDVAAERQRQVEAEGWSPEHDDEHDRGELARAAATYALYAGKSGDWSRAMCPTTWPWDSVWLKTGDRRRDLVKAAALIVAEIERLDRAAELARQQVPHAG